jgi:carotenoid cleavage dioxygenase
MEGWVRDLTVIQGEVPRDLAGTLYRIGPNPRYAPLSGRYNAWMGDGSMHAISMADGKVHYRNRWVRTPKWLAEDRAGRAVFDYLLPNKSLLSTGMETTRPNRDSAGASQGSCNTSLTMHPGKTPGDGYLIAWGEGQSTPAMIDPRSLETLGFPDWTRELGDSMTPKQDEHGYGGGHPRVCPVTGETVFYTIDVKPPYLTVHFLDTAKGTLRSVPTASPYASYIHDFMITREHAVVLVSPATMSQARVAEGRGLFAWEPELGTHLVIVPRDPAAGEPVIIQLDDNTYCLHPQNAYVDAAGRIIIDGPQFPIAPVPCDNLDPWKQFKGLKSFMERWEIDLDKRSVKRTRTDERNVELPQCDRRYQGLEYRYGYNLCSVGDLNDYSYDALLAYDMQTGAADIHRFKNGDTACEPLFAPRCDDSPEGDGYLMTLVYRPEQDRSDFVILDAKNLSAEPVATVALPHRVPFSAHGCWVADVIA